MKDNSRQQVDLIREVFYYQSRFAGSTMVFKIDNPLLSASFLDTLVRDLCLLARTGIKIIVIPGAKERINAVLKEYHIADDWQHGLRITSEKAISFVKMAAFDVASQLISGFAAHNCQALIGNFVRARSLGVVDGVDFLHTGTVDKIYTDEIHQILERGMVAIIPCVGWAASGRCYNLSSENIALEVCRAFNPAKFFVLSAKEGLFSEQIQLPESLKGHMQGLLTQLRPSQARDILSINPDRQSDTLADLKLGLEASLLGVDRVHLVDGRQDGAVLRELFSNLGQGTMIYADEYESLRPLQSNDIPEVLRILEDGIKQGQVLPRTAQDIEAQKDDYLVCEIDRSIYGCAALHDWGEGQGEIAALATEATAKTQGIGRRIVRYLLEKAKEKGLSRVFVLTTQGRDWFENLGFSQVDLQTLPPKKLSVYDSKRKSSIFAIDI